MAAGKTGTADLPLHRGRTPRWLFSRMVELTESLYEVIMEEFDSAFLLERVADPFWFQAFGCVIGFDWHSSGVTTVATAALKEATSEDERLGVAGGKGTLSRKVRSELTDTASKGEMGPGVVRELSRQSKMSSKVDSAVIQDGYDLYHHALVYDREGRWTVIQQGMNPARREARRYHWTSLASPRYFDEPHSGIAGRKTKREVLNLATNESEEARKCSVDLANERPNRLKRTLSNLKESRDTHTLNPWLAREDGPPSYKTKRLDMPRRMNWTALEETMERGVDSYEELVDTWGIGPATIRGLAYISELVYGDEPSWREPARFSFAFGGKDGVPYPVDEASMTEATVFLRELVEGADWPSMEKRRAFARLGVSGSDG